MLRAKFKNRRSNVRNLVPDSEAQEIVSIEVLTCLVKPTRFACGQIDPRHISDRPDVLNSERFRDASPRLLSMKK